MTRRGTPARSRQPVCYWCRTTDTTYSPYRTPLEDWDGGHEAARIVCSPGCPDRPAGAVCFRRPEPARDWHRKAAA